MEIVNTELLESPGTYQEYKSEDTSLVSSVPVTTPFGTTADYIEYFIYDSKDNIIARNYFDNQYTPTNPDPATGLYNTLNIDPEADVRANSITRGVVNIEYNFLRVLFNSTPTEQFWIKEISSDRTELRVTTLDQSNLELQQAYEDYNLQTTLRAYYSDYYLNFGDNKLVIAVNVLYALENDEATLLIKLYEPLPDEFDIKSKFWAVEKLGDSIAYRVSVEVTSDTVTQKNTLRGPNYNVDMIEKVGQATPLYNYATLFTTPNTSSYQQVKSLLEEKGIDINVDYTKFSEFSHFSSVTERLYNFVYKLKLIESYQASLISLNSIASNNATIALGSKTVLQDKINNIIEKFDGYEYFLYYESGSDAWPKSTSTKPYTLFSTTSSQAINWLGGPETYPTSTAHSMLYSASVYDNGNKDLFLNTIPEYLREDSNNVPYETFMNMIGQHFDNIWIYVKDVSTRYDANNNLNKGISKDLVGDALKGLGMKLYTNSNTSDNIYYSLLGLNPNGGTLPPTGSEQITYYITSSAQTAAAYDITTENYKRLYHNLPYLLKTRGTERGLRALINCFGIPDTILRVNEFGGSDKSYATPDLVQSRHALSYYNSGSTNLTLPWVGLNYYNLSVANKGVVPSTVEFRFNTTGIPDTAHTSQSIFEVNYNNKTNFGVNLVYNSASAVPSSSYRYNGDLTFFLSGSAGYLKTNPITLPFFDKTLWWNVMLRRDTGGVPAQNNTITNRYWVYVKGTAYNEEGNAEITYEKSESILITGVVQPTYNATWNTFSTSSYANMFSAYLGGTDNGGTLCPNGTRFQGYFQEFRYWSTPLTETAYDEHIQNSTSYRGNISTASLFDLTFRLPLGSNLNVPYLGTSSIELNKKDYDLYELGISTINANSVLTSYHPAITGTLLLPFNNQISTGVGSFISGSTVFSYGLFGANNQKIFTPTTIVDLISTPSSGIGQKVNNKVQVYTKNDLSENVLSPWVSLQNLDTNISKNSVDIEVGFSPADNIDADITNQLGYFNIDDYIGNPADVYSGSYASLDNLRTVYFQKYAGSFKLWDFVRLIKYYDNSLFKMIKDFVPAKANLSTGIIVKPNILERSKYPRNEPITELQSNLSCSIDLMSISGSNPEGVPALIPCVRYTYDYNQGDVQILTYPQCGTRIPKSVTLDSTSGNVRVTVDSVVGFLPNIDDISLVSQETYYPSGYTSQYINTAYTASIMTPLGAVTKTNTDLREPFTGEFSGSRITATSETFSQTEGSFTPTDSGSTGVVSISPLLNNVSDNVRSVYYLAADYNSNTVTPTNNGLITGALALYQSRLNSPGSTVLSSPYWPFAEIGDYNYNIAARVLPRYEGSKTISALYNTYTAGDGAYGKTAAIDKRQEKYAYLVDIYTASFAMPGRSNAQIKYLIDNDENTINLTKANANVFDIQNLFKSGDPSTVALFDYNPSSPDVQTLTNNQTLNVYQGGFRYAPVYHNISGSVSGSVSNPSTQSFSLTQAITVEVPAGSGLNPADVLSHLTPYVGTDIVDCQGDGRPGEQYVEGNWYVGVQSDIGFATSLTVTISYNLLYQGSSVETGTAIVTLVPYVQNNFRLIRTTACQPYVGGMGGTATVTGLIIGDGNESQPGYTYSTFTVSSNMPYLQYITASNQIVFNDIIGQYATTDGLTFDSTQDPNWAGSGLEKATLPLLPAPGDRIAIYNQVNKRWDESFESVVTNIFVTGSGTGSRLVANVSDQVNLQLFNTSSNGGSPYPKDSTVDTNWRSYKYVLFKLTPDETNLVLRYDPKSAITQDGLVYPYYLQPDIQKNSGNVLQSLKANNLI